MTEVDYLIVGAGISGLTAALTTLSCKPTAKVLLIDAAAEAGGLLRSEMFDENYFDLGTHIPENTVVEELNKLLFPEASCHQWYKLSRLNVGNYFGGKLNERSQFLDISIFPDLAERVRTELLSLTGFAEADTNLDVYLQQAYGSTLTAEVFAPLLLKLTALHLSELSSSATKYYGLSRIICGNREQSIHLKHSAHLDRVLAFAADDESPRRSLWYYPNKVGIGAWVQLLQQNFIKMGGQLSFNTIVDDVSIVDEFHRVSLQSDDVILARNVIWTVPTYFGLTEKKQQRPDSRSISIFHFKSDTAPSSLSHYIYCHDPFLLSYRVTLYSNIQKETDVNNHRCSVEVIHDMHSQPCASAIEQELKQMQIFSDSSKLDFKGVSKLASGFPIPRAGSEAQRAQFFNEVCQKHPNITFLGRAKPHLFFMTDVLVDSFVETKRQVLNSGNDNG